jgi:hypothetical protein
VLFVEDLLHGQELDDPPRALMVRRAFLLGIAAVAEGGREKAGKRGRISFRARGR